MAGTPSLSEAALLRVPERHDESQSPHFGQAREVFSPRGVSKDSPQEASCGLFEELAQLKTRLREESLARRRLEEQLLPMTSRLTQLEDEAQRLGVELQKTMVQREELSRQIGERQNSVAKLQSMCRKEQETRKKLDRELAVSKQQQLEAREMQQDLRMRRGSKDSTEVKETNGYPTIGLQSDESFSLLESEAIPEVQMDLNALTLTRELTCELTRELTGEDEKENQLKPERDGDVSGLLSSRSSKVTPSTEGLGLSKLAVEQLSRGRLVLSQRDLSELKALKRPPAPVRMLMEICCVLFEIPPQRQRCEKGKMSQDYWEPARRFLLSDSFFLPKLRTLTPSQVSPAQRARIRRYLRSPELAAQRVGNCSRAALELLTWVQSLVEPLGS